MNACTYTSSVCTYTYPLVHNLTRVSFENEVF